MYGDQVSLLGMTLYSNRKQPEPNDQISIPEKSYPSLKIGQRSTQGV